MSIERKERSFALKATQKATKQPPTLSSPVKSEDEYDIEDISEGEDELSLITRRVQRH